jgi:hypothetical protein
MPTAVDLIRTLTGTPDLPGAACVEHRDIFDACTTRGASYSYHLAIQICIQCPVLLQCRAWVTSLPPGQRPRGVTAGLIRTCR